MRAKVEEGKQHEVVYEQLPDLVFFVLSLLRCGVAEKSNYIHDRANHAARNKHEIFQQSQDQLVGFHREERSQFARRFVERVQQAADPAETVEDSREADEEAARRAARG